MTSHLWVTAVLMNVLKLPLSAASCQYCTRNVDTIRFLLEIVCRGMIDPDRKNGSKMTFETSRDLASKHYVVTGANSGIGFVAADNFASRGATVALVCRDTDLGNRALDTIRYSTHDAELKLFIADFSSLHSVASLAKDLMHTYSSIDALCNNAGGANSARHVTADGFETTIAVNQLAGFALTQQLMPSL
ncbi:MAG: SDR family NAD(P)-dependent oxidoreductase [Gammaproteobacteria bacterium]|nr:SDR family NAD(P)-dependent oxidoreductase [Gammaproteobacteria bacterium]